MRQLLLIFLSVLLFSCSGKNELPKGILKPAKMQEVFWDFIRADVYTMDFIRNDSSKNMTIENLKLQDKIFALHKTTREEFYNSYRYYSNHKELMTSMMDSMISRKQKEKTKTNNILKEL